MGIFGTLSLYMTYPFVKYALIAGNLRSAASKIRTECED